MVDIDYISKKVNEKAKKILEDISFKYELTDDQKKVVSDLLKSEEIVIVDDYSDELLLHFNQGIVRDKEEALMNVPSGHGGRNRGDGKVHMITFSPVFKGMSEDEMINNFLKNVLVHEIFHYFIMLDKGVPKNSDYEKISHFLTEGFVQLFAEEYSEANDLEIPKSNYDRNVEFAKMLRSSTEGYSEEEFAEVLFRSNALEVLNNSFMGIELYHLYEKSEFIHDEMVSFLEDLFKVTKDFPKKEELNTKKVINSMKKNYDFEEMYPVIVEQFYKYMIGIQEEQEKDTSKGNIEAFNMIYNLFIDRLNAMGPYIKEIVKLNNDVSNKLDGIISTKRL